MSVEELANKRISRQRLLKSAGVGAVLLATPVMSSTASGTNLPRFVCKQGCEVGGDPCFGQRNCTNADERFCTCLLATGGRCICHEPSSCSCVEANTPPGGCTRQADCPENWFCAASCCSADASQKFCHPPCGTPCTFPTGAAAALSGRTSVGTR
jgi:hypothetical protein